MPTTPPAIIGPVFLLNFHTGMVGPPLDHRFAGFDQHQHMSVRFLVRGTQDGGIGAAAGRIQAQP